MDNLQQIQDALSWVLPIIIIPAFIWGTAWKIIGMWKAGRNNHLSWFICIALINTLGILPIVYILMQKKKSEKAT
jgi:Na+-driven multidrug efflux pump